MVVVDQKKKKKKRIDSQYPMALILMADNIGQTNQYMRYVNAMHS